MRVAHHLQIQSSYLAFTTPLFYHHQSINTMFRFQFLLALCLLVQATSFAPTATTARSGKIYRPASLLSGARPTTVHATARRMSSNDEDTATGVESKISADGTFYDDEVDSAPIKTGISDSMRARLMAEANTGLDSNTANTNVLLYIIAGVSLLVILGGAGIFY